MKTIYTIIIILVASFSQAQVFICGGDPLAKKENNIKMQSGSNVGVYDLNDLQTWIPYCDGRPLRNPPITYINVTFHVFLDNDGGGSRYTDSNVSRTKLIALLNNVNDTYSGKKVLESGGPSDKVPGVRELPQYDTRIRFTLGDYNERIYFYKSTEMNQLGEPLLGEAHSKLYNYINNPAVLQDGINVFFIASSCDGVSAYASPVRMGAKDDSYVVMFSIVPTNGQHAESAAATVLAHELGHTLDLKHTYCGGGSPAVGCTDVKGNHICKFGHDYIDSEYLSDVFGPCNSSTFPHIGKWVNPYTYTGTDDKKVTNNVMGGTNTQTYISPMQAGQMHRAIALKNVGKYVKKNAHSGTPLVICQKEVWNFSYVRMFHDIQIRKNGNLTLDADYDFYQNCSIEIEDGGVLCIEKSKSMKLFSNNKIVVKKGGTLIISGDLDISEKGIIDVQSGGYLCIKKDANIKLKDFYSMIKLNTGALLGVNTNAINSPGAYYTSVGSIAYSGNGSIVSYTNNVYIQNQTISKNTYVSGKNIYAGNSVTATKSKGDVVVKSGSLLVLDASNDVVLNTGFEVPLGATLEIK